jgi:hypothetical protein
MMSWRAWASCLASTLLVVACGGGGGNSGSPTLGNGAGTGATPAPSLVVGLSTATVTAAAPATVTAKLVDAGGAPIPSQVVTFETEGKLGSFSATAALTDANGVATVTLAPVQAAATGADTLVASATVGTQPVVARVGFQLTATNVAIQSFTSDVPTLGAYGQTGLRVVLSGTVPGTPVNVVVSSGCVAKNLATLTPTSLSTSTGVATFTYRDQGCGSFDAVDGVQASVTGAAASAALQLGLTAPNVSSIAFVSSTPESIFLKGSGFVENANIVFQVRDANGAGVPNRRVVLEPTTLAGGLLLDGGATAVTKATDAEGKVLVRINAGTVPTPVRVRATLEGSTISTVSSNLAIAVGLPSQNNFSLSQRAHNIEGYDLDGTRNVYTIIASDRLGNPVPAGTAINFVTEGGQVEAIRNTVIAEGLSQAVAQFQSSSPRPVDGRITVLAYALGEESFLDANGNNVYDVGEDYQDLGDIYIDRLFNNTYNGREDQFISLSIAGTDPCHVATSSLLRLDASAPSRVLTEAGQPLSTCVAGWGRAYVRRAIQTVLSTSSAAPLYGTALPANAKAAACPTPISRLLRYAPDDSAVRDSFFEFGTVDLVNQPKAGVIRLIAADANPVAHNPVAAGTVITASGTEGMAAGVVGGSPVPSTLTPTGVAVSYSFDDKTFSGTLTVTFRSPSGLASSFTQFITQGDTSGTTCP